VVSTESPALAAFVGKWLAREPEMAIAEVFCPAERKPLYRAWGGLLHELREAAFELSDARVTEVKTGWWAEELIGVGQGRHRHPLTEVLVEHVAPWSELGRSLLDLPDAGRRYGDAAAVIDGLMPIARSVIAVESALFSATTGIEAARALVVHWLLLRLPHGVADEDQARIPMHLFARHGLSAAQLAAGQGEALVRDWAGELLTHLPRGPADASPFRRSRSRFDEVRLRRLAAGKGFGEPAPLGTLWRAWRAARS
jgi:phytoene/squalene synthetase